MNNKAVIAMSGGVDSSVAALIMKEKGFECIGATMKLYSNGDVGISNQRTCCSLSDVEDARSVASKIGIPYYVFNFSKLFKEKVIDKFCYSYENGITPNPCIDCNRYLKFEKLHKRAAEIGYDYVVTGHYARIENINGKYILKKAIDLTKDQSYVLYSMTQEQLKHTLLPLGDLTKNTVRAIAKKHGFYNSNKPDSQDICFVPDNDYKSFIKQYRKNNYEPGYFKDKNQNILGRHNGIINYTVGQRKGLGISFTEPLFVTEINVEENTVYLGTNEGLFSNELIAENFNSILYEKLPDVLRVKAKIRYRQVEKSATVYNLDCKRIKVVFDSPQRAITKGQAVVLYDGDIVVGGGVISEIIKE